MNKDFKDFPLYPTPPGARDILPVEATEIKSIQEKLRLTFEKWGYQEIITPTFEYLDTLSIGAGETMKREMLKFFDTNGKLLALRPEMTTSIARVVVQRFKEKTPPFRLYYLANVFREEQVQRGQQREFFQAGAELIGGSGFIPDAEVIALVIEGLLNLGLKKFKVGVGQIEIISGLIESFSLSLKSQEEIRLAISQKDLVSLEKLVEESDLPLKLKRLLVEVPSLRGEEEVLQAVSPYLKDEKSKNALNNLERVYKLLKSYGLGEFVSLDLGVVRSFDYYTGVVFEVCAEGLGFPIGGGGRYDRLLSEFGWNMPAAGFALGIERTHIALTEQKVFKPEVKKRAIVFSTKGADFLFEVAKALRQQNITIETSLDLLTPEESINLAKKQQVNWVVNVDNFPDNLEVVEVRSGKSQKCQSDALGKMLR